MVKSRTIPVGVDPHGMTALIQNLGRDCVPEQFIREFVQNGIEAVQRTKKKGQVLVDYNKSYFDKHGVYKICFIDNGDGMTSDQMLALLNNLSASGSVRNQFSNYGVGAKIAALIKNHAGVMYDSWRNGVGSRIYIAYDDEEGIYGVQRMADINGDATDVFSIPDDEKPDIINEHGTRVTLLGMDIEDNTMETLTPVAGKEAGLSKYLNTRYHVLPDDVEISARIGYSRDPNDKHNYSNRIKGLKISLDTRALLKGEMRLSDANLYWWIMPKNADTDFGKGRETLKGHTALVVQNEVFDLQDTKTRRVQNFGVLAGEKQVVIHIEPDINTLRQSTTRTHASRADGSEVNWDKWYEQFRANMPPEFKKFLDEAIDEQLSISNVDDIKDKLKSIRELYKLNRYKPNPTGKHLVDPDNEAEYLTGGRRNGIKPVIPYPRPGSNPGDKKLRLLTSLLKSKEAVAADAYTPDPFPLVVWKKGHTEETAGLVDRAAMYVAGDNTVIANCEFQGYVDLVEYLKRVYGGCSEVELFIHQEVKDAFQQVLMECVAGASCLKNRPEWGRTAYETAISPEALTTSVMSRYWMLNSIKRSLGNKLKVLKSTPDTEAAE
jgi:hypothetical protein